MKVKVSLGISLLLTITFLGVSSVFISGDRVHLGYCSGTLIVVPDNYQKVSWAVGNASDGDTVLVRNGSYSESQIIVNKTLTITGESTENTTIDGGGTAPYIFHIIANHVTIENFTLKNTTPPNLGTYPYAVRAYNVTDVTVKDVMITNVTIGIDIQFSKHTEVRDSGINRTKSWGVRFSAASCNNTIVGNNLEENPTAICFADTESKFNNVYHNNFVNNTINVPAFYATNYFDDGYPSGGNYWSDYTGNDTYSGPNQNETGSDGILDEGYPEASPWDRYPFANPLTELNVAAGGESFEIQMSTNSTVNSCNLDEEGKKLITYLSGSEGTNGSCRISIPKRLLSCDSLENWTVSINGTSIYFFASDDENSTYLYFTYNHTGIEEAVEIRGTKVIPEFDSFTFVAAFIVSILLIAIIKKGLGNRFQRSMRKLSTCFVN